MNLLRMRLRGGLGNQLFQAVAMSHFSKKFSSNALLDDIAIIRHRDTSRRSWLRSLDIESMLPHQNIKWTPFVTTQIRAKFPFASNRLAVIDESELASLLSLERNFEVVGWFQSNSYLPGRSLKLSREMLWGASDKWLNHGEEIEKAQKAAIHVRLGDFRKTVWGALPNSYYQRAVVALLEGGVQEIDCYSDDIEDAKSIFGNLRSEVNMIFPEENSSLNPLELLWVLSSYKYFASSNSSLSWWASYLNRNKEKTIYCPWGENLMMKEWVRI